MSRHRSRAPATPRGDANGCVPVDVKAGDSRPGFQAPLIRPLEPRIVFDAAADVTAREALSAASVADHSQSEIGSPLEPIWSTLAHSLSESAGSMAISKEVVFVSNDIENWQELIKSVGEGAEVIVLDHERDGVEQVLAALQDRSELQAIHFFTHGDEGRIRLAGSDLTIGSIQGHYADAIARIGASLSDTGDILFYGCDVSAGSAGKQFIDEIASRTGADVASSDDRTGSGTADWDLEVVFGELESRTYISRTWTGTLTLNVTVATNVSTLVDAITPSGQVGMSIVGTPVITGSLGSNAYGVFTTSGSNLGMDSGVVLGTGDVTGIAGAPATTPNWSGAGTGITGSGGELDLAQLSFDFVVDPGVTKVAAHYILGSEEYNEYVGQIYSDNARILLSGGVYSDTNIALVPGTTTSVDINTINLNNNNAYYRDNSTAVPTVGDSALDGHTTALTAIANVAGGTNYTVKFATADVTDNAYNSAMFISYFGSSLYLDLDANNSTAAGTSAAKTYMEATAGIAIVDTDVKIRNFDPSTDVVSAKIVLLNAKAGDVLSVGGLPAGISSSIDTSTAGQITVTLTGTASEASYETALKAVAFSNTNALPDITARNVSVVINDGATNSNVAYGSIKIAHLSRPVVDLNSTPVATGPTTTIATSDYIINGNFGSTAQATPPSSWTEGGNAAAGAVVLNGADGRWVWSTSPSATLSQSITVPVATSVTTSSGYETTTTSTVDSISSVSFGIGWLNQDTARSNTLSISYNGITYATLTTSQGAGSSATWTYANGASGPASLTAVGNITTGTLSAVTINLPTGITASGALRFSYNNGTGTGTGYDDIAIDNVAVMVRKETSSSTTTADTANNDWSASFVENGISVAIADSDTSIFDADSSSMTSVIVSISNPQAGDQLLIGGSSALSGTLASGIAWTSTGTTINLSGVYSKAQYADAIKSIAFRNTSDDPNAEIVRDITVVSNDGTFASNTAHSYITITPVNDLPVAADDTAVASEDGTASGTLLGNDSDADGNPLTVTGFSWNGTPGTPGVPLSLAGIGTLVVNPDGTFLFTPAADYAGAVPAASYTIGDGAGGTATASLSLAITPVNDLPVAEPGATDRNPVNPATMVDARSMFTVSGIIIDTVDSISHLGGMSNVPLDRPIERTVNNTQDLKGTGTLRGQQTPQGVTETVRHLERQAYTAGEVRNQAFDTQPFIGASSEIVLKSLVSDAGIEEVRIEALRHKNVLYLQLVEKARNAHNRDVTDYRIRMADGSEMPSWLRRVGPETFAGIPGADSRPMDVVISVVRADGLVTEHELRLIPETGQLVDVPENDRTVVQPPEPAPMFSEQIRAQQIKRDVDIRALEKALGFSD